MQRAVETVRAVPLLWIPTGCPLRPRAPGQPHTTPRKQTGGTCPGGEHPW